MGNKAGKEAAQSQTNTKVDDILQDFDLSQPHAAVIGAGMAGVHTAYELARIGFRVTVFDKHHGVAEDDGTRFTRPVVGVGNRFPGFFWHFNLPSDLIRGVLPLGVPDVYSADQAHISFFTSAIHRWLYTRFLASRRPQLYPAADVQRASQELAAESARVVAELQQSFPSLRSFVRPLPTVAVSSVESDRVAGAGGASSGDVPPGFVSVPATAEFGGAPLAIDAVGWTQELATLCAKHLPIDFKLGSHVTALIPSLRHNTEFINTLHYTKPSTMPGALTSEFVKERFDVVVITTGGHAAPLTKSSAVLPIIELRGAQVQIPAEHPAAQKLYPDVKRISGPFWFGIDAKSGLTMSTPFASSGTVLLSGLYSFDTFSSKSYSPYRATWDKVTALLRTRQDLELPPLGDDSNVSVAVYDRNFAPDGLPVIGRVGKVFNCFCVLGLGDQMADYAPGGARLLASQVRDTDRMINGVQQSVVENPFALDRFPGLYCPVPTTPSKTWHEYLELDLEPRMHDWFAGPRSRLNRFLTDLAREDNAPHFFRNLVFQYFCDEIDQEALTVWIRKEKEIASRLQTNSAAEQKRA